MVPTSLIRTFACAWSIWTSRAWLLTSFSRLRVAWGMHQRLTFCDTSLDRSLDNIYKTSGPIPEDILGKIAFAVVSGLTYLYDVHRIIHRGELVGSSYHYDTLRLPSMCLR